MQSESSGWKYLEVLLVTDYINSPLDLIFAIIGS